MLPKCNEGYLALFLSIISFTLPKILEETSKQISSISILTFFCTVLLVNICFEYIHSLKREYIGEGCKIKFNHIFYCSCLTILIFAVIREFLILSDVVIILISIAIGYTLYYCRVRGRKDVWVTIFTSNKRLRERANLYKYEVIYDRKNYNKLDLLIIYNYITLDQLDYCKLTSLSNDKDEILNIITCMGYIGERELRELNYIYNHYIETGVLINKDLVRSSFLNREKI